MFKIILKLKILENCTIRPETIRNDRNADNLEQIMRKKQMLCQKKKKKCLLEEYEFFEVAQIFGFAFSKMLLNHIQLPVVFVQIFYSFSAFFTLGGLGKSRI